MKLLIVIVNYDVTDLAIDCLNSVAKEIPSVCDSKVVVCDNGSKPGEAERLEKTIELEHWSHWATVKTIHPNRGFCVGNNVILQPAFESENAPQYALLLNSDTVLRRGALRALVGFMDHRPDVGIAGSRLEDPDGRPQISAFPFVSILGEFDRGFRLGVVSRLLQKKIPPREASDVACPCDWVAGASMIIRREVIRDIGYLDEGYFTYFDDIDYCLNARRAGWPTWYVPDSRVIHLVGQTTGVTQRESLNKSKTQKRIPRYWYEARRRYFLKNHGPTYAAIADLVFIVGYGLWYIRRILQRKPNTDPDCMWLDAIFESVFLKGFKVEAVVNPLITKSRTRGRRRDWQ